MSRIDSLYRLHGETDIETLLGHIYDAANGEGIGNASRYAEAICYLAIALEPGGERDRESSVARALASLRANRTP